mmetsp:Transcript_43250/g.41615  ORF Transcript_43250/g.41615 Transcript_43250/m.41615 type:complete len:135 (+) Transcript_43250:1578-1982(+)
MLTIITSSLCSIFTIGFIVIRRKRRFQLRIREQMGQQQNANNDASSQRHKKLLTKIEGKLKRYNEKDENKFGIETCCICLDNFRRQDQIKETNCKHIFHHDHLMEWIKNKINEGLRAEKSDEEVLKGVECPLCC